MKTISGIWLFLIPFFLTAQSRFAAEITPFANDKAAAVSITFDDGTYTQYRFAFPLLEKYRMKATFSVVGEWVKDNPSFSAEPGMFMIKKMGWNQIDTLSRYGHEIASHGYYHRKFPRHAPSVVIANEMQQAKQLVETKLHRPVWTLHYPYSFTSDSIIRAARKAGFLFGRTGTYKGVYYNDYRNFNPLLLKSIAFLNDTTPSLDSLRQVFSKAEGKWLILMYHHLFPENSREMQILRYHKVRHTYSVYPATFEKHLQLLQDYDFWIAPEATVGKYMTERKHARIKTRRWFGKYIVRLKTDLDTAVYGQPLTVKIKLPWKKVRINGSLNDGIFEVKDNFIISVLPQARIVIKKLN